MSSSTTSLTHYGWANTQRFLYPKWVEGVTSRPVLSRQRSSRTGCLLTRQVTSEVASAQYIADRLSDQDTIDSRILGAIETDLREVSEWEAVVQSHQSLLERGVSTPDRVVQLLQHGAKVIGLRKLLLLLLSFMPADADLLGRLATVLQQDLGPAKSQQLASKLQLP